MSVLRDYQSEIIDDCDCLVARAVRSVLVTAPTGSGKMVIASALVASAPAAGRRGLVLAHPTLTRRRLLATWASFMERRP